MKIDMKLSLHTVVNFMSYMFSGNLSVRCSMNLILVLTNVLHVLLNKWRI